MRATGSGAGCGEHWPLCNGQVVPRSGTAKTIIEFVHRITSGLSLIAVFVLARITYTHRQLTQAHRRVALASCILMVTEALIGAGLVLFGLVAENQSMGRAFSLALHLANTFLLLSSVTLTAYWASWKNPSINLQVSKSTWMICVLMLIACMWIGISGAVAALGDTLFPSQGIIEGIAADFSTASHFLIRLRILHPVIAVSVSCAILIFCQWIKSRTGEVTPRDTNRFSNALTLAVFAQVAIGFGNVVLLAPVWMQLVHLLMADFVWMLLNLLIASVLFSDSMSNSNEKGATLSAQVAPKE